MQTTLAPEDSTAPALARVTPIIVTYNSAHCLPALVPLLAACPRVILSDNASSDGSADEGRRLLPHATVQKRDLCHRRHSQIIRIARPASITAATLFTHPMRRANCCPARPASAP